MGSISIRKRKDGNSGYLACVRVMREGTSYHETKTFDRRPAATAWIEKREKELAKPGALEGLNVSDPLRSKAIERHTEEAEKEIGRTKAQVLRTIATCRLSQGHAKQHLHRRARLDGGVAAGPLPATSACRCGIPGHGGLEPTSRDIAAQCTAGQRIVSEPRRLSASLQAGEFLVLQVGGAHASRLPLWIREMNPPRNLCTNAGSHHQTVGSNT